MKKPPTRTKFFMWLTWVILLWRHQRSVKFKFSKETKLVKLSGLIVKFIYYEKTTKFEKISHEDRVFHVVAMGDPPIEASEVSKIQVF